MNETADNCNLDLNTKVDGYSKPNRTERIVQTKSILDCEISSVTVYLDKAEICRTVPISLEANQSLELLLNQLSMAIDKDSVRIEAKAAAIIIQDVSFQTNTLDVESESLDAEIQEIETTEKENKREKESCLSKQSRLKKQRAVLEKFADILVCPEGDNENETNENEIDTTKKSKSSFTEAFDPKHMETLNGFFVMYESQAEKLDELILSTKHELLAIEEILGNCTRRRLQLEEIKERNKKRELSVFIESKETVSLDLKIHYVVDLCSWKPCYDIRMITSESKMKITYYSLINQSTLEDWNDIKQLIISTVQPPVGGSVPEIGIQKVFFKSSTDSKGNQLIFRRPAKLPKNQRLSKAMSFQERPEKSGNIAADKGIVSKLANRDHTPCLNDDNMSYPIKETNDESISGTRSKSSTLERQETTTKEPTNNITTNSSCRSPKEMCKVDIPCAQYTVPRCPELIASGEVAERVVVGYIDLNPTFEYASVPKRAPYAYLKATAVNNSEYVILPGEANIFIDSNFIGKTELKTVAPGEEFTCNLGADHRIHISYHPMYKYKEGSGSLSKTMCLTYKQMIEVTNLHPNPIKMILMDQLPISNEEKIKISLQEPTIKHPEKYDKSKPVRLTKNSQVEWDLEIGSGEKKELILKYAVEYPAGECLDLINE